MLFGKHEKRTVSFLTLWEEILTAHLKKNSSNYGVVRSKNAYVDLLGIYSGEDNVTYVYSIDAYPRQLEVSFRTTIRKKCKPGVRVSFVNTFEKHDIDWNSSRMKAKLRVWKTLDETSEEVDEYNMHRMINDVDNVEWKKDSLYYLSTADKRRQRKMYKLRGAMFISGKRGADFDNSVKDITSLCLSLGFKISRVIGDIPDYLRVFSPFSNMQDPKVFKKCGCVALPDELLSRMNTYAQGIVGRRGLYWGTDIYSSFPCLKTVKKDTDTAENWLITAETGGGKSVFAKGLTSQLLAFRQFNGTIMDVEGFEYTPLGNYVGRNDLVVILNMAEGSGCYYDPVPIILTGVKKLDSDMYGLSTSFTLSLFKCLLGDTQDCDEWVDIVINDAVATTYGQAGVDPADISTWAKSSDLSLFDVYNTLKSLKTTGDATRAVNSMFTHSLYEEMMGIGTALSSNDVSRLVASNEGYQRAIDTCIAKVSRYFEPNGIRASVFRKRITIEEIKDAKLVICSFGMAGKSPETVDPIQMSLMQLYSANISHLRSIFSKCAGKYNFKLWEEFQRWGGFPDADKTINVALTGGRKLGDINIIVTNKVGDMLKDDKFGVFSNLTSIAVGCIWDAEVRNDLCKRLTIEHLADELETIVKNNQDLSAFVEGDTLNEDLYANPYKKAFLLGLDKTIFTVSRMSLPRELIQSSLFKTGIDQQAEVYDEEEIIE